MRLDGNGMSMDMGRKGIILAGVFVVYLMTACAERPDSEERGGIRVAVGESADRESRRKWQTPSFIWQAIWPPM